MQAFAFALEQAGRNADADREQWNERQQRGVGQGRSAHRAAIAPETFPDHHPEMRKPMQPRQLLFAE